MIFFAIILTMIFPILSLICNTKDKLIVIFSIFASFSFLLHLQPLHKPTLVSLPVSAYDFLAMWVVFRVTGYIKLKASNSLGPVLFWIYSMPEWFCASIQMLVMFRKHYHRRQPVISSNLFLPQFHVIIWMHS